MCLSLNVAFFFTFKTFACVHSVTCFGRGCSLPQCVCMCACACCIPMYVYVHMCMHVCMCGIYVWCICVCQCMYVWYVCMCVKHIRWEELARTIACQRVLNLWESQQASLRSRVYVITVEHI